MKIEHFSHFHDISYGHNTLKCNYPCCISLDGETIPPDVQVLQKVHDQEMVDLKNKHVSDLNRMKVDAEESCVRKMELLQDAMRDEVTEVRARFRVWYGSCYWTKSRHTITELYSIITQY